MIGRLWRLVTAFTSVPTGIDIGGESVQNVSAASGHNVALTFTAGASTQTYTCRTRLVLAMRGVKLS